MSKRRVRTFSGWVRISPTHWGMWVKAHVCIVQKCQSYWVWSVGANAIHVSGGSSGNRHQAMYLAMEAIADMWSTAA